MDIASGEKRWHTFAPTMSVKAAESTDLVNAGYGGIEGQSGSDLLASTIEGK